MRLLETGDQALIGLLSEVARVPAELRDRSARALLGELAVEDARALCRDREQVILALRVLGEVAGGRKGDRDCVGA
jgi:hypothetical protein